MKMNVMSTDQAVDSRRLTEDIFDTAEEEEDEVAAEEYLEAEGQEVDEGTLGEVGGCGEGRGQQQEGQQACGPGAVFPPFVYQDAQAVEAAPGDKVERRAMPQASEEHGVHVVDIGAEGAAMRGAECQQE